MVNVTIYGIHGSYGIWKNKKMFQTTVPSTVRWFPQRTKPPLSSGISQPSEVQPWMLQGSLGGNPAGHRNQVVAPEGASKNLQNPPNEVVNSKKLGAYPRSCSALSTCLYIYVDSVVFCSQSRDDPIFRASKYAPWWFNPPTKVSHIKPETRNHQLLSGWNHHKSSLQLQVVPDGPVFRQ